MSQFPKRRMRRLRRTEAMREMVRETRLHPAQLTYPLFVVEESSAAGPIPSMPGIERFTLDSVPREIDAAASAGIRAILLFGVPKAKDAVGSGAYHEDGIVQQSVQRIKQANPDIDVMTDLCLCQYTDHGHCGAIKDGHVDNDQTLELIARTAVSHARAGADVVAPSGMMDGAIAAIREGLDESDFQDIAILSYAAKYASSFYGPFRDAAESAPKEGNRRGYQMNPANVREALAEVKLDVEEGADMLMVKPAMPYLDVIHRVRQAWPNYPLAAYQVSGEYSMLKAAARNGWLDEKACVLEALTAIKRAGADMIITYFAKQAAGWLRD